MKEKINKAAVSCNKENIYQYSYLQCYTILHFVLTTVSGI